MWSPDRPADPLQRALRPDVRSVARAGAPGVSLRELLEHRIKVGSFSGNPDQYIADLLTSIAKGKTVSSVREHEGRFIAIVNRPMGDGGWVATHEDVTEQRVAEQQRIVARRAAKARRAVIEEAIAGVPRSASRTCSTS